MYNVYLIKTDIEVKTNTIASEMNIEDIQADEESVTLCNF